MKTISTQYTDSEVSDFDIVLQLLNNLVDEEFLVLIDEKDTNYIQVAFENEANPNSNYLLEMRVYQSTKNFKHYRCITDNFDKVLGYFYAFYHDKADFDLSTWQDVTAEFLNALTLDTRLGGECYDGYIADFDSIMEDVRQFAESAEEGDFVHIFDDKYPNSPALIIYPNFDTPIMRYDVAFKNTDSNTPLKTYNSLLEIEKIVRDFLDKTTL